MYYTASRGSLQGVFAKKSPLSLAFARQGRVAAPSVCFAVACILLAAAPTAPPCFRRWRRSSPLLLPRGGLGIPQSFASSPEAPLLGELAGASPTERLDEGRLDREALARLNLSVIASQCHCPGCGSQRLLRSRSHPAGRCPNSSSLFPPLAAVVAVAPTEGRPWHSAKLCLLARGSPTRGAGGRKPD